VPLGPPDSWDKMGLHIDLNLWRYSTKFDDENELRKSPLCGIAIEIRPLIEKGPI
jgi:hypothetical protein